MVSSLFDRCFAYVFENLRRFVLAFSPTEDTELQKNLEGLRIQFSPHLIRKVTRKSGKLDLFYFQFLFNEHLKQISMSIFKECDWPAVLERMRQIGHGFHEIRFDLNEDFQLLSNFEDVVNFVNTILHYLPNVKILDLTKYGKDSTLKIISTSCLHLEKLRMDGCFVTNEGLMSLCPLLLQQNNNPEIKYLNLKYISLSRLSLVSDGISYLLQNMPSLEVIMHPDVPCILYDLHNMNSISKKEYNLTSLHFDPRAFWNYDLTDVLTVFSEICPNIKEFSCPIWKKEQLDCCLKFKNLEDFSAFDCCNLDFNEFLQTRGRKLRRLKVDNATLSVAVLIHNCFELDTLHLQNVIFEILPNNIDLKPLKNLKKLLLEGLLFGNNINRQSLLRILSSNQQGSSENKNETVNYLSFFECNIDYNFLKSVLSICSNLKTLSLYNCNDINGEDLIDEELKQLCENISNVDLQFTDDRADPLW